MLIYDQDGNLQHEVVDLSLGPIDYRVTGAPIIAMCQTDDMKFAKRRQIGGAYRKIGNNAANREIIGRLLQENHHLLTPPNQYEAVRYRAKQIDDAGLSQGYLKRRKHIQDYQSRKDLKTVGVLAGAETRKRWAKVVSTNKGLHGMTAEAILTKLLDTCTCPGCAAFSPGMIGSNMACSNCGQIL